MLSTVAVEVPHQGVLACPDTTARPGRARFHQNPGTLWTDGPGTSLPDAVQNATDVSPAGPPHDSARWS
jgi:hypothetical protein